MELYLLEEESFTLCEEAILLHWQWYVLSEHIPYYLLVISAVR
jgi:hypothetical protein